MNKLCDTFNIINRRFGSHRVSLHYSANSEAIEFSIRDFGRFEIRPRKHSIEIVEVGITSNTFGSRNAQWLEGIATGRVRDAAGNMVERTP